jgi:hypothetical protein
MDMKQQARLLKEQTLMRGRNRAGKSDGKEKKKKRRSE